MGCIILYINTINCNHGQMFMRLAALGGIVYIGCEVCGIRELPVYNILVHYQVICLRTTVKPTRQFAEPL